MRHRQTKEKNTAREGRKAGKHRKEEERHKEEEGISNVVHAKREGEDRKWLTPPILRPDGVKGAERKIGQQQERKRIPVKRNQG